MNEVDLYCDVLRARLLSQEGLTKGYNTDAGIILSIGAAMIGFGAVILRFSDSTHAISYLAFYPFIVMGVMGLFFLLNAITTAFFIFRPTDWRAAPGMAKLSPNLGVHQQGEFTKQVADAFGQAVDSNQRVLDRKARCLQWAILWLIIEVIALVVLASVSLWLSRQGGASLASQCPV